MSKRLICILMIAIFATGCGEKFVRPNIPETVTVTVEKNRDIPDWATRPLPIPIPADHSVGERLRAGDQAVFILDKIANCHRELLRRWGAGEPVTEKVVMECKL